MKILILDDVQRRLDVFRATYESQGHKVVTVMKYSDCLVQLNAHHWDLVHLDHDLGEFVDDADSYEDGWGNKRYYNGGHVVQEILAMPEGSYPDNVIIHSINPRGAIMREDLQHRGISAVWIPFVDPGWETPTSESE